MLINSLTALGHRSEQAVIINVGTNLVSTLALASAIRFTRMPVLLIDCKPSRSSDSSASFVDDGSFAHFKELMQRWDFDLLEMPLNRHSKTLDRLFAEIPAEKVLLVDSDLEILNDEIFSLMRQFIDIERVFGAGLVEGPNWMSKHTGFTRHGYFEERMWIPLTMLKVEPVRAALRDGHSFGEKQVFNDFAPSKTISRLIGSLRYRLPRLAHRQLAWLDAFKETHHGAKPWLVWYDTGAQLYRQLKYVEDYQFVGLPAEFHTRYARHFSGITNNKLNPGHNLGTSLEEIESYARWRLHELYETQMR